ncbi:Coiled-coil domain containing protein 173 [Dissostichus eleginoides]|uniref:Coiled-coil domain containing protein 173 n=1 Tax=Dissostichus eleginoides TaxID=100907 RepID=A0AAD9CKW8_DISEL|nr:Coiled-coil domain containing protein 173 [Dissostichus eleginoides]
MASVVQHGRRTGSSKRVSSAEEPSRMIEPPDLRQSTEVVKLWSNTIAGQRQKKLEAKKNREEAEEEKRKMIDQEEAKFQQQQREEAIEKAKTQLYYETNRIKGLHRALVLTEVLKEREAQIELKQKITSASKDNDIDEALRQEQEKALRKKLEGQAVVGDLKNQMKEREQVREREKIENRKDGEEAQRLLELHHLEQKMEEERQAKLRRNLMHGHLEHVANSDLIRATNAKKQEAEEEQRKLFLSSKQKMIKLRKEKEKELFSEAQMRREWTMNKLTVTQQEKTDDEEQRIAKAVVEQDEKLAQRKREEDEKKAAMLESITAHREFMRENKEQKDKTTKQSMMGTLQAMKEADRIFEEKQKMKAQKIKAVGRNAHEFNATEMAKKGAKLQQRKREEQEFQEDYAEVIAKEEHLFQQYSHDLINAAAGAQRNVFPLSKAAGQGIGGGLGPASCYLVQDKTGAQMPKYVSGATQDIKRLNEARNILQAKMRLGFTWS